MPRTKNQPTLPDLESMLVTQCREVLAAHGRGGESFHLYTRAAVMLAVCGLITAELRARHPASVVTPDQDGARQPVRSL